MYDDGDLVLIGPNVPHSWSSAELIDPTGPHIALVIWFSEAWVQALVKLCPEMGAVRALLVAARNALRFSDAASGELRPIIEAMVDQDATQRLISLLTVLNRLARDVHAEKIAPACSTQAFTAITEDARIHRALDYIHDHYASALSLSALAEMACVSVSAFHRMFRKHTRCTVLEYIVRLRVGHACALLMQGNVAVSIIAGRVGYSSQALFNRQFKAQKGMTPSEFRQRHGHHFQ
nr:AraC family transcriptional regulator [Pseudomonas sp. MWU12-2037]